MRSGAASRVSGASGRPSILGTVPSEQATVADVIAQALEIRALSDAPYHEPGLLSRMVDSIGDWVDKHADLLREISNVLKTVSAIAGLLSFIPALTPIFGPIAALTAGGALVIDAALVATGHGDWKALVVDAALMALPGAGRLASRAMMSARH